MRPLSNDIPAQNSQVDHFTHAAQGSDMKDDIAAAAARVAPPLAVTGTSALLDLTINQWVGIATLLYIALQCVVLIRNEFIRKRIEK